MEFLKDLNKEQLEAARTIEGPLLVIAGAGTGKTKTMISRAAFMIHSGIAPENILMLTFTNKAAHEMKERLSGMLGKVGNSVNASTFHSFFAAILRKYGSEIGLSPNYVILTSTDEVEVVDIVKAASGKRRFEKRGFPPSKKIVSIISKSVNKCVPIAEILEEKSFSSCKDYAEDIKYIAKLLNEYKQTNNLLDYDDILVKSLELFDTIPDAAKQVALSYSYIMVDEYQDTNTLQEELLQELFKYTKNIAVVGDDMQALYSFRGASSENILTFTERYPDAKKVFLTMNYRSNQEILDLSNVVVRNTQTGYIKELRGTHKSWQLPNLYRPKDNYQEADWIIEKIRQIKGSGVSMNEIAVLSRTSLETAALEMKLSSQGISYVKYGGLKFFEYAHIKDVLSYLRILINPKDEIAWFRVLQVHFWIGTYYANQISSKCKEKGMDELLNPEYARFKFYDDLKVLHKELTKYDRKPFDEILDGLIRFYLKMRREAIKKGRMKESNRTDQLEHLKEVEEDLETLKTLGSQYDSISEFLDDLVLDNTLPAQDPENALILSTVHSAKGLEFHSVIIMNCIDEVFPSVREKDFCTDADEDELRCFYVAVTRAKENLSLFAPKMATKFGRTIDGKIAHYIVHDLDRLRRK